MNNKEYIIKGINLCLASAVFLALFISYTYTEYWFEITNYIGQFGARSILFCLFIGIIIFYVYTFKKTRKYYYFSVPYLLLLTYFLVKFFYLGFIVFSDTFW